MTSDSWRNEHTLTGVGIHGHPVEVAAGVVDTPNGPAAALRVGICFILLDETLGAGLVTNIRRAVDDSLLPRRPRP
ncbi:hypothetical protein SD37_11845 [Amycolatopsis orientalis]|uniref:Uncharacterized protein n=1 Tax=Amycolatopsis orientalis TaxID=31958 RepID=A0A193BVL3_AMYOR|nr:hypothetical protein [Amycolatopsis orientalis]ANN16271.1 hypothetical protein SD37_11845 [Amycolatopsis orientalis]